MYMLFKNKRPVSNLKFDTYEKCRQWARKLIRSKDVLDMSGKIWRTPSITPYGYSIRAV